MDREEQGSGCLKVARKTHKVGGQKGNKNSVAHGCYQHFSRVDRRTKEGKLISHIEASLADALGGDLSPQEILSVQRASVIAWRCSRFEKHILSGNGNTPESLERNYLSWVRALMDILRTLGLERRTRNVTDLALELMPSRKQSL